MRPRGFLAPYCLASCRIGAPGCFFRSQRVAEEETERGLYGLYDLSLFFGRKHATANYGFLYTAKGTASVFVPIGSALAAGKAFDFRADVLLLVGGALAFLRALARAHDPAYAAQEEDPRRPVHRRLAMVACGIILTVVPSIWTPFAARFTLPNIGWTGVFSIAIVFDLAAAFLAFFVLRRMKVPSPTVVRHEIALSAGVVPAMKG